jgi:hypothetical protein
MFGFLSGGLLGSLFWSRTIWRVVSLVRSIGSLRLGPLAKLTPLRSTGISISALTGIAATHDHKAVVRVAPVSCITSILTRRSIPTRTMER